MYREWSIADGPADLTDWDVGKDCTFTLAEGQQIVITMTHVGSMFNGNVRSFGGIVTINHHHYEVIGTYNIADLTGHFQTTHPAT